MKSRLDKDFECEQLLNKFESEKKEDIFSSLNCDISNVKSLKRVSSSLMTCQKLYASHFGRYEKPETKMLNQIMSLKMIEQDYTDKNLDLNIKVAKLKAEAEKLRYQMKQKNVHKKSLWKNYCLKRKNSRL